MKKFIFIILILWGSNLYSQSLTASSTVTTTATTAAVTGTYTGTVSYFFINAELSTDNFANVAFSASSTYGGGNITYTFTGLASGTTYKYRFFSFLNSMPTYSNIVEFTTSTLTAPTVTTATATSTSATSTTLGGEVVSDGGASVTARGICYSTTDTDPRIGDAGVINVTIGSGTGIFSQNIINLKPGTTYYYNAYGTNSVGTTYGSPVKSVALTSIAQASNITFNSTTLTQTGISFTAGGGTGRLVLAKQGSSITQIPVDGADYTGGSQTFGSGTSLGDGTFVIAQGSSTTSTVYGLLANTTYYFQVYEYTGNGVGGYYYQPLPAAAILTTVSLTAPIVTTSTATFTTASSTTLGGEVGSDGGAVVTARGICYSNTDTDPRIGDTGTTNISIGSGTGVFTQNIINLKPGTTYYYNAYATNSVGTTYGTPVKNVTLLPIAQASNITFNSTTTTQTVITYTLGGGTGRLVLAKQGSPITQTPIDGAAYTGGSQTFGSGTSLGDGTFVIAQGSSTTSTVYGLSANTTYYFQVYEYTDNGVGGYYYQPLPAAANVTTLRLEPTVQATNITFSSILANSFTSSWSRGNGDGIIILAGVGGPVNDFPVDGTTYTADNNWVTGGNTASEIGTGNYVIYIGSASSVNLTGLTDGTYYEIRAFEFNNSGSTIDYKITTSTNNPKNTTTQGPAIWEGDDASTPENWGIAENWSTNEVPNASRSAIIPVPASGIFPTIALGARVSSDLTIEAGASLTINNGTSLTVSGNVLLETPANSGATGQIAIPGSGTLSVSGTSTMKRFYLNTNWWRTVSSPLTVPSISDWSGFYASYYDVSSQAFVPLNGASTLSVMQGIVVVDSISDKTLLFDGTFNNGNKSIVVSNPIGGENNGWNLVGNPYPSAIDWGTGTGITRTGINTTAYILNTTTGEYDLCTNPCIIGAGQGFFVHSDVPSSTLSFTNAARTASTQVFRKNGVIERPTLKLTASNGFFTSEAIIAFDASATNNYDTEYDAYKLLALNDSIAEIFSIIPSGTYLAINALSLASLEQLPNQSLSIPLGITPGATGYIDISASEIKNIDKSIFIYLYDAQQDIYIDLSTQTGSVYIGFQTDNRFSLVFTTKTVSVTNTKQFDHNFKVYTNEKSAFVKSGDFNKHKGQLYLFDISGRLIHSQSTVSSDTQEIKIDQAGAYIIKIELNNEIFTQKVIVQ